MQDARIRETFWQLRAVYFGLVVGILTSGIVLTLFGFTTGRVLNEHIVFKILAPGYGIIVNLLGIAMVGSTSRKFRNTDSLEKKLRKYRNTYIFSLVLSESSVLLLLVFFLVSQDTYYLILSAVYCIFFLAMLPTSGKLNKAITPPL